MRRIAAGLVLVLIAGLGAVLRFSGLGVPSLWLDEILDFDVATALTHEPLWRWITGFASEHGPLFFATELAGRFATAPEFAARLAPAVFGVATVLIAATCTISLRDADGQPRAAGEAAGAPLHGTEYLVLALLMAGSPLAIYYSREARPYALLVMLATMMLAVLLRAEGGHRWVYALPLLAMFTTSGAAPFLIAVAATAALAFILTRRRFYGVYAGSAVLAAMLLPLFYRRMPGSAPAGFRPLTSRFFQRLAQSFSIATLDPGAVHRAAYVVAVLALIGAIALARRDRAQAVIVIGMTVLPIVASLTALWRLRHWYAVRYVMTALPAYLLLVACGITALLRLILRGRAATAIPILSLIAGLLIIREGFSAATTESYRKLNWRVIAATIHEHAHERDAVVTTNDWSYVSLNFYLKRLPPRVRLISAGEMAARAASVVAYNTPVWIVSAGYHRPGDIGDWSCQYPVVLASPLESFRLHYAPGLRDLLLHRLTAADRRALVARYPSHVLRLGSENDFFLGGGWHGSEGQTGDVSRWTGPEPVTAMLIASGDIDHRLTLRMAPFDYAGAPPQIATITLNSAPVATIELAREWRNYRFDLPRSRWRDGINLLAVSFSRAEAPSSIDQASADHRLLAGRFNLIAVTPLHMTTLTDSLPELTRAFRINEPGELLDEHSWWRGRPATSPLAPPPLLARIGLDPTRRVALHNIAEAVAYDADCLNDSDFLHIAYATILDRAIDAGGERYFSDALRKKETRIGVVNALVNSPEFRRQ